MSNRCCTSGCPYNDTIFDESCGYDKKVDFNVDDCPAYTPDLKRQPSSDKCPNNNRTKFK